jgi:hypothetical protein
VNRPPQRAPVPSRIATALASPVGLAGVPLVTLAAAVALANLAGALDQAFAAALLATLFGVIAGLPVALWIARQQQRAEEVARTIETAQRRALVLGVMRKELAEDLELLASRDLDLHEPGPYNFGPELRNSTWEAFSAGGELAWIDDPELLDAFGRTYHWVAVQCDLERHYREWMDSPLTVDARFIGTRRVDLELVNHMRTAVIKSREAIAETVSKIPDASTGQMGTGT